MTTNTCFFIQIRFMTILFYIEVKVLIQRRKIERNPRYISKCHPANHRYIFMKQLKACLQAMHSPIGRLCLIACMYVIVHFLAPYAYIAYCTPRSLRGFLLSAFLAPSPHCQAIRWTLQHTAAHIESMWMLLGIWTMAHIPRWPYPATS
jgi:hypothetical protein